MNNKGDILHITSILEGKTQSFSYLVESHKDHVFNLALRICGNYEDAEEIAQDSFMKAYRSLSKFRMESSFSTWLYRIVYNTAISHVRSRKDTMLSIEEFPADATDFLSNNFSEEEADAEYRSALVNFALKKINSDERALITLYYYEELSMDDLSEITGISKSNVKVKLYRARQKMSEIIEKNEKKNLIYHE
jgi:RNA polymerase sigma factor (sigma-70 family)